MDMGVARPRAQGQATTSTATNTRSASPKGRPPSQSQPSPAAFQEVYDEVTAQGGSAVVLTISAKISGTFQSASIAAEGYDNIFVVDTRSCSIGSGAIAERALELADSGMAAADIARALEKEREELFVVTTLDTLENLAKGGRLPKTVAVAGGLLNIKPVVSIENGEIKMLGKARGSRQANNLLVQEINKAGGVDFKKPVLLGYTGLSDVLLKKYIQDSASLWEGYLDQLLCEVVGSVVGTHAGPGAVAVAFFAADSE